MSVGPDFETIRVSKKFRIVLVVLDLIALVCVGYGKSYSGHTNGTVIDQGFLETVRQIVVHERFATFGMIMAGCFLFTTLLVFLPDFTEVNVVKVKWVSIISLMFGVCIFGYLLSDVLPIMSKPVTVVCDYREADVTNRTEDNRTPLVNSSDTLVREVNRETTADSPYYMVYCNGKIIRMYDIYKYTLGEDVK